LKHHIFRKYEISSAHYLPGHPKCGVVHGHNYLIELGFETKDGEPLYLDFAEIDLRVKKLLKNLDHRLLNDVIKYPSVENIATYIFKELYSERLPIKIVRVHEDSRSYCEVVGDYDEDISGE